MNKWISFTFFYFDHFGHFHSIDVYVMVSVGVTIFKNEAFDGLIFILPKEYIAYSFLFGVLNGNNEILKPLIPNIFNLGVSIFRIDIDRF